MRASLLVIFTACGGARVAAPPAALLHNTETRPPDPIVRAVEQACAQIGQPRARAVAPAIGGEIAFVTFGGTDLVLDAKVHVTIAAPAACARLRGWGDGTFDAAQCDLRDAAFALQIFQDPVDDPPTTLILCDPVAR